MSLRSILALSLVPVAGLQGQTDPFAWETAGGNYLDPTSFFALHGYVNAVYGSASPDWMVADPTQLGPPGQLLAPNTASSGFQYDAAAFLSTEISPETRMMIEAHLVSDPSGRGAAGPGGLTIALTEVTASWDVLPTNLTVSAGLFWAPFGIANRDWLGAQNLFTLVPRASGPFPAHFNERGVRVNGAVPFGERAGMNYVVSVGNGVQTFDVSGQTATDVNDDKTVVARFGVFPGLAETLEIGYSVARGDLRQAGDPAMALDDPAYYPSRFFAHGADATLRGSRWMGRGYFIVSRETLIGAPNLRRMGAMAEVAYRIPVTLDRPSLEAVAPMARIDWVEVDGLDATGTGIVTAGAWVTSFGIALFPAEQFRASVEYHVQRETAGRSLDNDRLLARLTAQF